jgi:hypothetical protein
MSNGRLMRDHLAPWRKARRDWYESARVARRINQRRATRSIS